MLLCYYVICLSRCGYCESSLCRNNIITLSKIDCGSFPSQRIVYINNILFIYTILWTPQRPYRQLLTLLCYYVIMLLQRRSSPSTILFNNTMQLSMYMRLTTNATILKALPRPFADNIYHFRRLSKKFPRLLSSTSKKQGGAKRFQENAQLCGIVWLHRQAKNRTASVATAPRNRKGSKLLTLQIVIKKSWQNKNWQD